MKKIGIFLLSLLMGAIVALGFSSCKGIEKKPDNDCMHTGGVATCMQRAVCNKCGLEYGEFAVHELTIEDSTNESYLKSERTCETAKTYYKICSKCGANPKDDTKVFTVGEPLGHSYGEWEQKGNHHTRVCANDSTHVENVNCSVGENGKEATCMQKAVCGTCEKSFGEPLNHTYVNGVCSKCGGDAPACAHNEGVIDVAVDLSSYSLCTDTLYYKTCECGEVKFFDYDEINCLFFDCGLSEYVGLYSGERNLPFTGVKNCVTCDLTAEIDDSDKKTTCFYSVLGTIDIKVGDTPLLKNAKIIYADDGHNISIEEIEISGLHCIRGIRIERCNDCNKVISYYYLTDNIGTSDAFYACSLEFSGGIEVEDEKGNIIDAEKYTCSDCGLVYTIGRGLDKEITTCRGVFNEMSALSKNGEIIAQWECEVQYIRGSHVEQKTYDFGCGVNCDGSLCDGHNCEKGYKFSIACSKCGEVDREVVYYHGNTMIFEDEYDLSEYGACRNEYIATTVEVWKCPCGRGESIRSSKASNAREEMYDYYDENGVLHYGTVIACEECGLEIRWERYEKREEDWIYSYNKETVSIGNFNLTATSNAGKYIEHDYVYSYNFGCGVDCDGTDCGGHSCENGYTAYGVCRYCEQTIEEYKQPSEGHLVIVEKRYNLSEYNVCGSVAIETCPCGQMRGVFSGCENTTSSSDNNTDTITCFDCDLVRIVSREEKKDGCYVHEIRSVTLKVGETIIEENIIINGGYYEHNYVDYSYDFGCGGGENCEGNSCGSIHNCENEYTIRAVCADCKQPYESKEKGHNTYSWLNKEYELADYGGCGGDVQKYSCPCGESGGVYTDILCQNKTVTNESFTDGNGYRHTVVKKSCSTCGLMEITDGYSVEEGCYTKIVETLTVKIKESAIVENLRGKRYQENHEFLYAYDFGCGINCDGTTCGGHDCEKGYEYYKYCKNCDYNALGTQHGHDMFLKEVYDLSDYDNVCGGTLKVYGCGCGKTDWIETDELLCETGGEVQEEFEDVNGGWHKVSTYSCDTCTLNATVELYTIQDESGVYEYEKIIIKIGAEKIAEFTQKNAIQ